jgi:RAB protein geranylgeranyltransferase component A
MDEKYIGCQMFDDSIIPSIPSNEMYYLYEGHRLNYTHPVLADIIEIMKNSSISIIERKLVNEFIQLLNNFFQDKFHEQKLEKLIENSSLIIDQFNKTTKSKVNKLSVHDFLISE